MTLRRGTSITDAQRTAAKVVGLSYLLALCPAVFAEFYVRSHLVSADAAQTGLAIVSHERLFRLGIASNLTVFATDVVLLTSLYVVLGPINRGVSLLAAAWGLVETTILVVTTLSDLDVLRFLGSADYLHAFTREQLFALVKLSSAAHPAAYNVALVFSGLRGIGFCFVWLGSQFIPGVLAAWGLFASALMGACAFLFIVFPEAATTVPVGIYGGPIFLFELAMGVWLLTKGLRPVGGNVQVNSTSERTR